MVEIGILNPCGASEWVSPSFIAPKKDGCVKQITALHLLNKAIVYKKYPIPLSVICSNKYQAIFFTKLDVSMQYYTIVLNELRKKFCIIVKLFSKYKYKQLPLGLKCAPEFAQQVVEVVLHNVEDTGFYPS